MNKSNNRKPTLILIAAWLLVLLSYYLQTLMGNSLFSRSGSMMVLITVVGKQMLLKGRNEHHQNQLKAYTGGEKINFEEIHPSKKHQYLETFAHINIVLGTVIWGYGDLLFR